MARLSPKVVAISVRHATARSGDDSLVESRGVGFHGRKYARYSMFLLTAVGYRSAVCGVSVTWMAQALQAESYTGIHPARIGAGVHARVGTKTRELCSAVVPQWLYSAIPYPQ